MKLKSGGRTLLSLALLAWTSCQSPDDLVGKTATPLSAERTSCAQDKCKAQYQGVLSALLGWAHRGLDEKLTTKVVNAVRLFAAAHPGNAGHQLDVALKLLDGPPTKGLPESERQKLVAALKALRACLEDPGAATKATLTVRTFRVDETKQDQKGGPADGGAYVYVNGEKVGLTGPDGTLVVKVAAGTAVVQAVVPSFSGGEASIVLAAGATSEVSILLDDSKEIIAQTDLHLVEVTEGVLPRSTTSLSLRFEHAGALAPLVNIHQVELLDRDGNVATSLTPWFALSAGALVATDVPAIMSAVQSQATHEVAIRATGIDAEGFTHQSIARFYVGQFHLQGTLTPPPSAPGLNLANIKVRVEVLGTSVAFDRVSDANGHFDVAAVPIGNVGLDSQTLQNGVNYYGQGTTFLTSDRSVSLVMRSVTDVVGGVAASGVANASSASKAAALAPGAASGGETPAAATPDRAQAEAEAQQSVPHATSVKQAAPQSFALAAAGPTASVSATAGPANVPMSATTTLNVPKGTQTVTLTYSVFTIEYPTYVLSQSIYNDVWTISAYGGPAGQQLYSQTRNINSQVSTPPIWQSSGSTGDITQILDVSALTAAADATVTLFASATNIGDSALATTVSAQLSTDAKLTINAIEPDAVSPTTGDSSYYSIPMSGATNVFSRWFTLAVTKPAGAMITHIRAVLRGGGDLMTVVDEAPGANFQIVDEGHVRVRVTMTSTPSTVTTTPPPTDQITYRFTVQAEGGGQTFQDERESGFRHALWRMPAAIARYGVRDQGLDDWASRGCYSWLTQNANLVTSIDDISGEHARNIGHNTHERGVDIDQFHYYTFPGGGSGGNNYVALRNAVFSAMGGNAAAATQVASWVSASRAGLQALLARPEVNVLYYAIGNAEQQVTTTRTIRLSEGWAQSLIRNGSVTAITGEVLDTSLGAWSQAGTSRMQYNAIHNSHIHIALNSTML
jgi:hypothetical protein